MVQTALWLLGGLFLLLMIISAAIVVTRSRDADGEEHDIEHLDHEVHGDAI